MGPVLVLAIVAGVLLLDLVFAIVVGRSLKRSRLARERLIGPPGRERLP